MKFLHPASAGIGDKEVADNELVIATTRDELAILANAINETLEALEDWEFDTRLGVGREQTTALRDRINDVLRVAHRPG